MRSTIFTSLAVALIAGQVMAQTHLSGGCYARAYTADHLAANPDQVVARIVLFIWVEPETPDEIDLAVWTGNQGHVAASGTANRRFDQSLMCWREDMATTCEVECDGSSLQVERADGEMLQFRTSNLTAGQGGGCGDTIDLTERPGQPVSYRLSRAPHRVCADAFGRKLPQ